MKGKGYFVVHEWMITELGLRGVELLVYAIIYGFTQIEEQSFFGTRRYLADSIGSSIRAVQSALDSLVSSGCILKMEGTLPHGGVRVVSYKANLQGVCNNFTGVKTAHIDNIHNNISMSSYSSNASTSSNTCIADKSRRFQKPSVEEVQAYCMDKGYRIDAAYFIDYYDSKGWLIGKTPMKDWKAAVRTWVRNQKGRVQPQNAKTNEPNWFSEDEL